MPNKTDLKAIKFLALALWSFTPSAFGAQSAIEEAPAYTTKIDSKRLSEDKNSPAQKGCNASQLALFSCSLPSKVAFAMCLSRQNLTPEFVWSKQKGQTKSLAADNLMQSVSAPTTHGATMITVSQAKAETITLFVDTNPYDASASAVSVSSDNHVVTEFCLDGSSHMDSSVLRIRDKENVVNLFRLKEVGLAHSLASRPEWPDEDQKGINSEYIHHPSQRHPIPNSGK